MRTNSIAGCRSSRKVLGFVARLVQAFDKRAGIIRQCLSGIATLFCSLAVLTGSCLPGTAMAVSEARALSPDPLVVRDVIPVGNDSYGVFWVNNCRLPVDLDKEVTRATFGDTIEIHIKDLNLWRQSLIERNLLAKDVTFYQFLTKLVLVLDGLAFEDITADTTMPYLSDYPYHVRPDLTPEKRKAEEYAWTAATKRFLGKEDSDYKGPYEIWTPETPCTYTLLKFRLMRTENNRAQWAKILRKPVLDRCELSRRMQVSVGIKRSDGGYQECPSWVRPYAVVDKENSWPRNQFYLVVMPWQWILATGFLFALSMIILGLMARTPGLLRDPNQPPRADGLHPFSLSRCQMTLWIYIVTSSFILIWVTVARDNAINSTATILLGITSATAVGAALVGSKSEEEKAKETANGLSGEDVARLHPVWWRRGSGWWHSEKVVADLVKEAEVAATNASPDAKEKATRRWEALKKAQTYLGKWSLRRFLVDILSENETPSIGRFQMMTWTLVLGIVFAIDVYSNLDMPDFDVSILALMGISAGAYLGFKASPKG